jgi:hypothetical protein
MTPAGYLPQVTFIQGAPDPVLEFNFGGGNIVDIQCDGSRGIKSPANRDCFIAKIGSNVQDSYDIDPSQEWVLIIGAELSTDRNHSVYVTHRINLSTGLPSDIIVYSANAAQDKAAVASIEIPTGGGGLKVPPTVGVSAKRKKVE